MAELDFSRSWSQFVPLCLIPGQVTKPEREGGHREAERKTDPRETGLPGPPSLALQAPKAVLRPPPQAMH